MAVLTGFLDEVDEHDKPTGRIVPRSVCDDQDALHRCIAVYVHDQQGRIYLQVHKKSGLLDHSVGGHVDAGEDYRTAAAREAFEELGLADIPLTELATSIRSREQTRQHMFGLYECRPSPEWVFQSNDEVDEIIPMHLEDIVIAVNTSPSRFTSGFINVFDFYLKRKQLPYKIVTDMTTGQSEPRKK